MTQEEWDEIEAQRDIAFKIMYFFIVFILATFGMLYAYFKMAQSQNQKGLMEGKAGQAESFADFLTGSYDQNYLVNPQARGHVVNKTEKAIKSAAQSLGLGLKIGSGLLPKKKDIESADKCMDDMSLKDVKGKGLLDGEDHFEFEGESDDGTKDPNANPYKK